MPGWHDARSVSSQLGRMEGGINEEEDRDLSRADKQCPTHYRMTSSHQSPGNREVTGMWVGGGQLRMSPKRHKLWRKRSALIKQWWQRRHLHSVSKILEIYMNIKYSLSLLYKTWTQLHIFWICLYPWLWIYYIEKFSFRFVFATS